MTLRRHRAVLALLLALAVTTLNSRWALAGGPTDQLRAQMEGVIRVPEAPELKKEGHQKDRRPAVRKIANEIFDFSETARRSLGRHWQGRTEAERSEFVQLFSDLLERTYISKIETYGGGKIGYPGGTIEGEQAKVQTKLVTNSHPHIPTPHPL